MDYKDKYHKYKIKYLQAKQAMYGGKQTKYTYLQFDSADKQQKYINKNIERIVDVNLMYFPANSDKFFKTNEKVKNNDSHYRKIIKKYLLDRACLLYTSDA